MKRFTIFALIVVLAMSLCACRMGNNNTTTTAPTTEPATTGPQPTTVAPIIPDPTIETNIPDTNVDDGHLIDTTDGTAGETTGDTSPDIRRYIN